MTLKAVGKIFKWAGYFLIPAFFLWLFAFKPSSLVLFGPLVNIGLLGDEFEHGPRFSITHGSNGRQRISFDAYTWQGKAMPFSPLTITDVNRGRDSVLWSLICIDPKNYKVEELEYGAIPDGWEQTTAPKPLENEHYYHINKAGDILFVSAKGDFRRYTGDEYANILQLKRKNY